MTSRFFWWWLHVFFLVILRHMWVSSEEPSLTNETYSGNITTGPDLVYITNRETSETPITTLETNRGDIATGQDLVYITNKEASGTSNTTLEKGNVTSRPDLIYITSKETSRTPNNTLEGYTDNITTGPDLVYISSKETSGAPNTTLERYWSNVTIGPDLVYITPDETPSITLETYPNNFSTGLDLTYIFEDISQTPNSTLETYRNNFSTGLDLTYIFEDISRTPNSTLETYTNDGTTSPVLSYISEVASETSNVTVKTYLNNVTTAIDLIYTYISEETSRTPKTTVETNTSNVTTEVHPTYISEETSAIPNTTLEMERTAYPGITKAPDLIYTIREEPTIGTPSTTLQTGAVYCLQDADCPPFTMCTDLEGLHICQCHLGSHFHHELGCVTARTFPARISVSVLYWDEISVNASDRNNNEDELRHAEDAQYHRGIHRMGVLFQNVLGHIPGYLSTSVIDIQLDEGHLTIIHSFSTLYPVTEEDVWRALTVSPLLCADRHLKCMSPLTIDNYQGLNLCDFGICDPYSSSCHSYGGLVKCDCLGGYYKFSPTDRSCRACESGFQWTENGCKRCPIGFSGLNCEESYILVVIVESCVGCVLLVSLITLLVFYFRRKEPDKPKFIDSIILGVPTDQPSLKLPRAQFSWRREWEWNGPSGKVLTDVHREADSPDEPAIHMKTFGDPARFSAPNSHHGHQNLSFVSE